MKNIKKLALYMSFPLFLGLVPIKSDDPNTQKSTINRNFADIEKFMNKMPNNRYSYPWVDCRDYSSINAAVTYIGIANKTLLISTPQTLTASLTIPSNINLVIYKDGSIIKASSYTLIINGTVESGNYQIFSGFDDGDITGIRNTNVRWWGAKGNNSNNDTIGIQSAITCAQTGTQTSGSVYIPAGIYLVETTLDIAGYCDIYGDGRSTVIQRSIVGGTTSIIYLHDTSFSSIRDMTIFSTVGEPTNGIYMRNVAYSSVKNITFCGVGNNCLFLEGVIGCHFENIRNSSQVAGTSGTPDNPIRGVYLDKDTVSGVSSSTTNTFLNCSFDLVTGQGVRIVEGSVNTFIGCSVQNDGTHPMSYGVYIDGITCFDNIFINIYFGEGAYGTAQIYDKGNRTIWIAPYGETSAAFMWAGYGDNRYFTIHPNGNYGIQFFNDTSILRPSSNVFQINADLIADTNLTRNLGSSTTYYMNIFGDNLVGNISTLANSATPTIQNKSIFITGGTTTITNFTNGITGQIIKILSEHAITITDGTNIFLNGSINFIMKSSDTLTLIQKADGKWYEIGRSVN